MKYIRITDVVVIRQDVPMSSYLDDGDRAMSPEEARNYEAAATEETIVTSLVDWLSITEEDPFLVARSVAIVDKPEEAARSEANDVAEGPPEGTQIMSDQFTIEPAGRTLNKDGTVEQDLYYRKGSADTYPYETNTQFGGIPEKLAKLRAEGIIGQPPMTKEEVLKGQRVPQPNETTQGSYHDGPFGILEG
jgi:hypothetical protein